MARFSLKAAEYWLKGMRAPFFKMANRHLPVFDCPVCGYQGPFKDKNIRKFAKCPRCGELERARVQMLVLKQLFEATNTHSMSVLHFAPENAFRKYFRQHFGNYRSADLRRPDVDYQCDVQEIPVADGSFDLVFASHVLEYPEDDRKAIREIRRVLKPGGMAILPVPIMHDKTVDLTERNPQTYLMHEPGLDYFDRYREVFARVDEISTDDFSSRYQLLKYLPGVSDTMPLEKESGWYGDIVPVCYA